MSIRRRAILSFFLALIIVPAGSAQSTVTAEKPTSAGRLLTFTARPTKPLFDLGEEIVFRFRLRNVSSKRIFVSRYMTVGDFITLTVIDPDGKKVPWQGKIRSVGYSKDAFQFLETNNEVSAAHTISLAKGEGFEIKQAGRYTVIADYSLGPPEYFANLAPKGSIPEGPFKAPTTHFTITASRDAKP